MNPESSTTAVLEDSSNSSLDSKKRKMGSVAVSVSSNKAVESMLQINPHLNSLKTDYLYHLGLNTTMDLKGMFGDVKFVLMGGSPERMFEVITKAAADLKLDKLIPVGCSLTPVGKHERYHLYKLGPIISVSHGMGMPSLSILLHEITKLMHYAEASDYCFIRIGTSGGLGVPPGTVVITTGVLNGLLEPNHTCYVLGRAVNRPASLDAGLQEELWNARDGIAAIKGKTMSTDDFYEEQARMDGFVCDYEPADRLSFLNECHAAGVRNIEMEALQFASFARRAKVPCAIACVTLVDRLGEFGDQITSTPAELVEFSNRTIRLVFNFIRNRLAQRAQ